MPDRPWRVSTLVLVAVVYFLAAKFGLSLAYGTAQVTTVWPPTGIALAAMVILGYRYWPAIAVGAFFANLTTNEPFLVALSIAGGNTVEALLGAYCLRRFTSFHRSLDRLRDVFGLIIFSGLISTAVAATIGVTSLALGGLITWPAWSEVWLVWWIGDMMGALVVAPLIFLWPRLRRLRRSVSQAVELGAVLGLVMLIGRYVFTRQLSDDQGLIPLTYLFFPVILWAAVRFRQLGAVLLTFFISAIAIWGTIHGFGPFALQVEAEQNLISLQLFMFLVAVTGLILAAAVAERRALNKTLTVRSQQLERLNLDLAEALRQRRREDRRLQEAVVQLERSKEAMLNLLEDLEAEKIQVSEAKSRIEAMVMAVGEGLVVIDDQARILLVNDVFERLMGWTADEARGRPVQEVLVAQNEAGQKIPDEQRPYYQVFATGKPVSTSLLSSPYYFVAKTGRRFPVGITVTPMKRNDQITGAVYLFRDITHERDIDRAKTEFVSLASHELRTPLTIVRWSIDMLKKYTGPLTAAQRKYVEAIEHTGRDMNNLVDALLNVSRIEMGTLMIDPVPTKLGDLIVGIVQELQPLTLKKRVAMTSSIAPNLPEIRLDPQLIRVAITNLLTNAVKYTPPDGRVTITANRSGQKVVISVSDTGYGIPADEQPKVFFKLFRAENAKAHEPHGTGLGLYVTKAVIEQSGGRIWFASEENKGTTFSFELPLAGVAPRPGSKTLSPG